MKAATPPVTPTTIVAMSGLGVCFEREQALVDLAQRHGQRLLVGLDVDNGTHELNHVLLKLQVVGVNLASTLRGKNNQCVLGIDVLVIFAAKRARQINSYNLQLQQNMIQFVGPVVDVQPDEKPLAVSLREINEGLLSLEANPEA